MLVCVSVWCSGRCGWRAPVVCRSLPVARRFVRRLLRLPCVSAVDVRVLGLGWWRWFRGRGWFRARGFAGGGSVPASSSFVLVGSPSVSCVVGGFRCRSGSRSFVARFVAALRSFRRFSAPGLVPVSAAVPVGSPSPVCSFVVFRGRLCPVGSFVSESVRFLRACLAPRLRS